MEKDHSVTEKTCGRHYMGYPFRLAARDLIYITRETLSYKNPCPSSPSSTILRSAYMALNTLQQDWLL